VESTAFQALDRAIADGGINLTGKAIAGAGKAATAALDELCSTGYVQKSGGKSAKYTVTAAGRAEWERQASPKRRDEIRNQEKQRERKTLVAFLEAVEKKGGKALTNPERNRFPDSLRQLASDQQLVQPGKAANSYLVTPAGKTLLSAEQPIEQQIVRLKETHQRMVAEWRAAHQGLEQECARLDGQGRPALRGGSTDLGARADKAGEAFNKAIAELSAFAGLLSAARDFKNAVEGGQKPALESIQKEAAQLTELEHRVCKTANQQRSQLEAFERQVGERIREFEKRLSASKPHDSANPSTSEEGPQSPPESAVWEATRRAYEEQHQTTLRIGGFVKIPELTDAVRKAIPRLTAGAFHDLLKKWQQQDRLILQLCNDPRLEPRASEGIESPRGLLFYIQMR
jgi:predicted transcriptional regulator